MYEINKEDRRIENEAKRIKKWENLNKEKKWKGNREQSIEELDKRKKEVADKKSRIAILYM